jgi:hypothetical protein
VACGDDDGEPDADEDPGAELETEGLDEGLSLAALLADADAEGLADFPGDADELAGLLAAGEELAGFIGDADELASARLGPPGGRFLMAAESTVVFGISGHAAELMID